MSNFSVAVPTRNRLNRVETFVKTFLRTTPNDNRPELLFIHDAPEELDSVYYTSGLPNTSTLVFSEKSGLTKLWNQCILKSNKEWVLVCNDDAIFKDGWYEYLNEAIDSNEYLQINILHYGGFCINRRMILKNGWFDERFRGGGFEDIDWQVRISESHLQMFVDISEDFKLVDHGKFQDGTNWLGENNELHMQEKWNKDYKDWMWQKNHNFDCKKRPDRRHKITPAFRELPEIDWYPETTLMWEKYYGVDSRLQEINNKVGDGQEIYI